MKTPQPLLNTALCIALCFRLVGQRIMMDFGFGSFLDKFEARFGSRLTTVLLVLLGLAVSAFCVNMVATYAVIPVLESISSIMSSDSISYQALKTIQTIFLIFLFVLMFAGVRTAWEAHKDRTNAMEMIDQYSVFRDFAMNFWDSTDGLQAELHTVFLEIEFARTRKQRDAAIRKAREILDENRARYSAGVEAFNKAASRESGSQS